MTTPATTTLRRQRVPPTPAAVAAILDAGPRWDDIAAAPGYDADSVEQHEARLRAERAVDAFLEWIIFGKGPHDLDGFDASRIPQRVLGAALALDRRLLRGLNHEQIARLPRAGSVSSRRLRQLSDEFNERVLNRANLKADASEPAPVSRAGDQNGRRFKG